MAYHNAWFGSSDFYLINSGGQLLDQWFSAYVCFVHSLEGHCPNGGHNLMVLATTSQMEGFRYWICTCLWYPYICKHRFVQIYYVPPPTGRIEPGVTARTRTNERCGCCCGWFSRKPWNIVSRRCRPTSPPTHAPRIAMVHLGTASSLTEITTEQIAWWTWLGGRAFKGQHKGLSHCFACSIQCDIGDWCCPRKLASQIKSAPTPAGEPNVRAEAEKKKLFSPCYQNSNVLCNPQTSGLLLFCGCFTRHLLIWCLDGLKNNLTKHNLRNNTVSVQSTALKNIG